ERERDHGCVDEAEIARVLGAALAPEKLLEILGAAGLRLVLRRLRTPLTNVAAELRVLGLRVCEPVEIPVRVAERSRDPLSGDLERPQRRRSVSLDVVERPRGRRAKGNR